MQRKKCFVSAFGPTALSPFPISASILKFLVTLPLALVLEMKRLGTVSAITHKLSTE